ncbi:1996_t:CDS:2 [Ambispora leptoticha]|uniref:1996_t:CDS:1 n=1 Tax=Ambispora leptoticha TaxID=144679 RepID=A0A9N9ADJ8_9GLOM|nr:1996_t:CDS:2 [Ambispora leptoticha]
MYDPIDCITNYCDGGSDTGGNGGNGGTEVHVDGNSNGGLNGNSSGGFYRNSSGGFYGNSNGGVQVSPFYSTRYYSTPIGNIFLNINTILSDNNGIPNSRNLERIIAILKEQHPNV